MMNIPCNYQKSGKIACWMCGTVEVRTEHYFECCEVTNIWEANAVDMISEDTSTLIRISKHIEGVEKRNVLCPHGKMVE